VPFRVVQESKYAEKLVGILYIKPHAIIANTEYELTFGTSDQKAMFSIKTNEDRPFGTFARGAAGIGYGRQR
jgi:hypothetical protein